MEPWRTPALTRYSCEDFPSRTTRSYLLLRKENIKAKYLTWNSIQPKFVKKTCMPNHVNSLGYIKCYSLSSPRPAKSPGSSIRHNCEKKKGHISLGDNNPIIYKFFKDFTNHRKKTNRVVVFTCRPFPNILK